MKQLHEYPGKIASIQHQLLNLNQQIEQIQANINKLCGKFELTVAFDSELKNEQQRKAKKSQLLEESGDYEALKLTLIRETIKRDRMEIELEQMRSEFSIAKLLKREAIARLEASTEIGV